MVKDIPFKEAIFSKSKANATSKKPAYEVCSFNPPKGLPPISVVKLEEIVTPLASSLLRHPFQSPVAVF